ncbi:MAG: RsmB/NOP family class I SAM-dependent RNA methyltransferase [archaeon]|nr:MAG: RsmB/NOP family class I SAM-dependent RNA methyltransferase [archaeon]
MLRNKPKPEFEKRIQNLLGKEKDEFWKCCEKPLRNIIRCNTLKISTQELKKRLEKKWKISQPYKNHPEILIIESKLQPGELGKAIEHQLGYYYGQELASMQSPIALDPKPGEKILDLCAAPGSKTTQIASLMQNQGLLIANDISIPRIKALGTNLERCGVTNIIVTRMNGAWLCKQLSKKGFLFDKILVDAPCSGEGTIRFNDKVLKMWNPKMIQVISGLQKKLLASAISCLKKGGTLIYSTCTFEPQENEGVIQFALDKFNVKLEEFSLPLKTRQGITEWQGKEFSSEMKKCKRVWPQDNDTEGFFVAKIRKIK